MGRRKKGCCKYCGVPFDADPYNHGKQQSCLKPGCLRAANVERQRRYRQKLREDPQALEAHRMKEAARAKRNRLKQKEAAKRTAAEPAPPWLYSPAGLQATFLGLLAQLTDSETMPDLVEAAGSLATRGSRLSGVQRPLFCAGGQNST